MKTVLTIAGSDCSGGASGLSATGCNQIFKQLNKGEENNEKNEND